MIVGNFDVRLPPRAALTGSKSIHASEACGYGTNYVSTRIRPY